MSHRSWNKMQTLFYSMLGHNLVPTDLFPYLAPHSLWRDFSFLIQTKASVIVDVELLYICTTKSLYLEFVYLCNFLHRCQFSCSRSLTQIVSPQKRYNFIWPSYLKWNSKCSTIFLYYVINTCGAKYPMSKYVKVIY